MAGKRQETQTKATMLSFCLRDFAFVLQGTSYSDTETLLQIQIHYISDWSVVEINNWLQQVQSKIETEKLAKLCSSPTLSSVCINYRIHSPVARKFKIDKRNGDSGVCPPSYYLENIHRIFIKMHQLNDATQIWHQASTNRKLSGQKVNTKIILYFCILLNVHYFAQSLKTVKELMRKGYIFL